MTTLAPLQVTSGRQEALPIGLDRRAACQPSNHSLTPLPARAAWIGSALHDGDPGATHYQMPYEEIGI